MAKANIKHQSSNHNQSGTKVRSIDELLAAKRANNQLGRNKATETGELKTKHDAALASNESRLLESSVIDTDWESVDTDFDMSFETEDWLSLESTSEVKSLPSRSKNNPFNSDDLPQ